MDIPKNENAQNAENAQQVETTVEAPPPIDAKISVSIAANELEAYLFIEPPCNDGIAPTLESMNDVLSDSGVIYNINMAKLKLIAASPIYNKDILIARGVSPVNGEDGSASLQIDTEKKSLKPKENTDGTVDYHALDTVQNVTKDQILCIITLPTEGSPGKSVKGKDIPQKKGRPVQSLVGKNTMLDEDGTAILSKIDGQVEFDGSKISVNDVLYINGSVDYSTGNINVPGNLVISGMVMPGFEIEAGGNIEVKEIIEDANVKAGGNITTRSGIIGSTLFCGNNLTCNYIENCDVLVKGSIESKNITGSDIKCGKSIRITGPSAKIIGGNFMAGENIEAKTIGSAANIKTKLELGTDHTVIERQQELLKQVSIITNQNKKLEPFVLILRQLEASTRLTTEKREALEKAANTYNANMQIYNAAKKELEEIAQSLEGKFSGRIICTGAIYPGTNIKIGKATLSITEALSGASLYYNKGKICIGPVR